MRVGEGTARSRPASGSFAAPAPTCDQGFVTGGRTTVGSSILTLPYAKL